jgi:hypothetical protein
VKAGKITIDLSAGTAQFVADLEKAGSKLRDFQNTANNAGNSGKQAFGHIADGSAHAVTGVQATSAALRTLEGNMTNNLRAAERFLANTLNLGGALQKIFPIVGGIAFLGVISELVTKANEAYEAFKRMAEAPKRIAGEFQKLSAPVRVANDELALTNDRLSNSIAKLEGKPQNGLVIALDEARLASDKLAESLGRSLDAVGKLLQEESISAIEGAFTGNAKTSDLAENFKKLQASLADISLKSGEQELATNDPTAQAKLYKDATDDRKTAVIDYVSTLRTQLAEAEKLQKQHDNPQRPAARPAPKLNSDGIPIATPGDFQKPGTAVPLAQGAPADQATRIAALKGQIDVLQQYLRGIQLTEQNTGLVKTKDLLEAAAANAKLGQGPRDKINELRATLAGVNAEVKAIGTEKNPYAESLAKGAAAAGKDLEQLNKQLTETHQKPVNLAQSATIQNLERQIALGEANKKVAEDWAKRLENIERLSAESAVQTELDNQKRDATLKTLNEEVTAAEKLAAAERLGPEAARRAQNEIGLTKIDDPAIQAANRRLLDAEQDAQNAKTIAQLQRQTDATLRLVNAQRGSVDAQRAAELATIRASGQAPDVIEAQIKAQQAAYELQDKLDLRNGSAMDGMRAYFEELANQSHSAAAEIHETLKSTFEGVNDQLSRLMTGQKTSWASFFQGLGQQISKLALGNLEQGLAAKLKGVMTGAGGRHPMDEKGPVGGILQKIGGIFTGGAATRDGNSAATALFVTLAGANGLPQFDVNGKAGDGATGETTTPSADAPDSSEAGDTSAKKTLPGWMKTLSNGYRKLPSVGSLLLKDAIGIAGGLATKGLQSVGGGSDSSDNSTRTVGFAAGGRPHVGKLAIVGERGPELFIPDRSGTIIPNHKLKFGGARAFGGNVDAGNAYLVGERGREVFSYGAPGEEAGHRAAAAGGGVTNVYNIDNRGTDAAAAEQRTKAGIIAAHQSAVVTASHVMQERAARLPRGGRH